MSIETLQNDDETGKFRPCSLSIYSIQAAIELNDSMTQIYLLGGSNFYVKTPRQTIHQHMEELESHSPYASSKSTPIDDPSTHIKKYDIEIVGNRRFSLDTRVLTVEESEEIRYQTLDIESNFPLIRNDALNTILETVDGVEVGINCWMSKYKGYISIGRMFNIEQVREKVAEKIRDFCGE